MDRSTDTSSEVRNGEELLRSLLDRASHRMGVVELRGDELVLLERNRAVDRVLEPSHRVPEAQLRSMLTPSVYEHLLSNYRLALQPGGPTTFLSERVMEGELRQMRISLTVLPVQPGAAPRFAFLTEDLTPSLHARDELQALLARHQLIHDSVSDLLSLFSCDGAGIRIESVNGAVARLFGVEKSVAEGKWLGDVLSGEVLETYRRHIHEAVRTGAVQRFQLPTARFTLRWTLTPLKQGYVQYVLGVGHDITEQLKLEQHQRVSDRMASLGILGAGVAHEINNPLSFITANVDFVRAELSRFPQTEDTKELMAALEDALEGARRVSRIVRDMGRLAGGGRPDNDLGPVEVAPLLALSTRLADPALRHRARVELRIEGSPIVVGDESRLGQVFVNLIVNAAQAMTQQDERHNHIELSAHQSGANVVLKVKDNGVGMTREVRDRVFDPFFTTRPVGAGTGLGLSVAHGIITALHGTITVESEPNAGTTFTVTLPSHEA